PSHLSQWAPYDANGNMGTAGNTVKLITVGAPTPMVSDTIITRADAPRLLEYNWGDRDIRWELEPFGGGTRLTLWHNIDRRVEMAMDAMQLPPPDAGVEHLSGGERRRVFLCKMRIPTNKIQTQSSTIVQGHTMHFYGFAGSRFVRLTDSAFAAEQVRLYEPAEVVSCVAAVDTG
ncbi:hypothetical protein B4Q13_24410, partial [Lacticaseibacillus rhamnosus]